MALALGSSLAASPAEYKHFPSRRGSTKPRRRTINHIVRAAAANRLADSKNNALLYQPRPILLHTGEDIAPEKRNALDTATQEELSYIGYRARGQPDTKSPRSHLDDDDGLLLAKSNVPLPSDYNRLARRPTLEREDAFRDASTSRGNVRLRRAAPAIYGDDDAQVAELYRMGLLYDDDAPDAFNLNTIHHDQALFTIRPAKRARRSNKARRDHSYLDLAAADLGGSTPARSATPVRVLYEPATAAPSYDVDTSQPPDLVDDCLSDYDYLSDGDLDDAPSQREVYDPAANPPNEAWIILGDDS
jgi:hypothetical protein